MYQPCFNCVLKTNDNKTIEYGRCTVYDDCTADFKSRFVPFFAVGTILKIYRLINKNEVSFYEGKVYLSTNSFLRLTGVTETILQTNIDFYQSQLKINAVCKPVFKNIAEKFTYKGNNTFSAEIYGISKTKIKFTSNEKRLLKGQEISFHIETPFISEEIVSEIYELLDNEGETCGYLSKVINLSTNDAENIEKLSVNSAREEIRLLKQK